MKAKIKLYVQIQKLQRSSICLSTSTSECIWVSFG